MKKTFGSRRVDRRTSIKARVLLDVRFGVENTSGGDPEAKNAETGGCLGHPGGRKTAHPTAQLTARGFCLFWAVQRAVGRTAQITARRLLFGRRELFVPFFAFVSDPGLFSSLPHSFLQFIICCIALFEVIVNYCEHAIVPELCCISYVMACEPRTR